MSSKMLIDASHPEETRVVVTKGNRVEEFDFESASRKQLRGNIYLAKVTRVEPSLQAAFVDFGGNRHGFLAFSEIHPDYYQIPAADRDALLADEARAARDDDAEDEEGNKNRRRRRPKAAPRQAKSDSVSETAEENGEEAAQDVTESDRDEADETNGADGEDASEDAEGNNADNQEEIIEQIGGADALEEVPVRHSRTRKQYKIQEVIKRRQILLVQVVKEERGNKGAALTTYLSLAGRYSVLMPNTARGGGISRKITSAVDRKRLKTIAQDLDVPEGMGVILRTAGAARTKTEVKRDFEYLMRLWESVRELTLSSSAPALVYEEGSLVKRAIRDLYSKEVEEVLVAGDEGYREAKDFMRMLMPSHAKMVQQYKEPQPLFIRHGVETQLDAMFNNVVTLKSGGYIVMNQTEALVSIDVNSGRSTREHNIEDTALKTNLEAAEEVARQLRLRDLAGLVVIDFIDMEEKRNNRAVERKINDCLKNDRARIQLGRISHFGLLEMSRQRIRTGVLESSTSPCPHCNGTGLKRGTSSIALNLVRALEEALVKTSHYDLIVRAPMEIMLYVLNHKRETLQALESRFGVHISFRGDETILPPSYFAFDRGELSTRVPEVKTAIAVTSIEPEDEPEPEIVEEETNEEEVEDKSTAENRSDDSNGTRRRRRRRRRRGGRGSDGENAANGSFPADSGEDDENAEDGETVAAGASDSESPTAELSEEAAAAAVEEKAEAQRRRRRRRGGRRPRSETTGDEAGHEASDAGNTSIVDDGDAPDSVEAAVAQAIPTVAEAEAPSAKASPVVIEILEKESMVTTPAVAALAPLPTPEPEVEDEPEDPNRPKRTGWWALARKAMGA